MAVLILQHLNGLGHMAMPSVMFAGFTQIRATMLTSFDANVETRLKRPVLNPNLTLQQSVEG